MRPWLEKPSTIAELKHRGLDNFYDELRCPRCGQVFKEQDVLPTVHNLNALNHHVGSSKCLVQESYKRVLTKPEWTFYSRHANRCRLRGDQKPPLCACGCGQPTTFSVQRKGWAKFVSSHHLKTLSDMELLGRIKGVDISKPFLQCSLHERGGKTSRASRDMSRLCMGLEKRGLIERKRTLFKCRWTFNITLTPKGFKKAEALQEGRQS